MSNLKRLTLSIINSVLSFNLTYILIVFLFFENKSSISSYYFIALIIGLLLWRLYKYQFLISLNYENSIINIFEQKTLFKTKHYSFKIAEIHKIMYQESKLIYNGYLTIIEKNGKKYIFKTTLGKNELIFEQVENLKNELSRLKPREGIASFIYLPLNLEQKRLSIRIFKRNLYLITLMLAYSFLLYFYSDFSLLMFLPMILGIILIIMNNIHNSIIDIKIDNSNLVLSAAKNNTFEQNEICINEIRDIRYSKSIFLINGELEIILKENEQYIFSVSSVVDKNIKPQILKLKEKHKELITTHNNG